MTAGLTQEALARRARLTPKFISQVENGHANPSVAVLSRIVEAGLDLPLAAFFAHDIAGLRSDLSTLAALLASQPTPIRRRALRVLKALVTED